MHEIQVYHGLQVDFREEKREHQGLLQKSALNLEEEIMRVKRKFGEIKHINCCLSEINTKSWIELGTMLIDLRVSVEAEGYTWTSWVAEKLSFLKERRRQQCMFLADRNKNGILEPFFHLGIDRLYDLLKKLETYANDIDMSLIMATYGKFFKPGSQEIEQKSETKRIIDIILDFFKFKNQVRNKTFDKKLLLNVLETGGKFQAKDYKQLNSSLVTPKEINEFFMTMILTGSSPIGHSSTSTNKKSIFIILSELYETVTDFLDKSSYPKHLSVAFLDIVISKLTTLRNKMAGRVQ